MYMGIPLWSDALALREQKGVSNQSQGTGMHGCAKNAFGYFLFSKALARPA